LRTLPLYFVILLAFIRLDYHGRHHLFDYPAYFVFLQNFAYKMPQFFELSWSLAIEEHFYFWFPLFFLVLERLTKRPHPAIILTAVSFVVIAYAFRIFQPSFSDWDEYNFSIRLTVLSRMDAIMFGVLMAATKHYWAEAFDWVRRATPLTAALFVVLCAWWFSGSPYLMQSRALQMNLFTVESILCALLLPWFDGLRSANGNGGFFAITSRLSYSLYLVHILVIIAVNKALQYVGVYDRVYGNPLVLYPIYFSFYYLVAWVTYHQIEQPFLRLRDMPLTWMSAVKASWVSVLACLCLIVVF
jgi:peptidoglycan/LPS O-acetylase OafA/YrhL